MPKFFMSLRILLLIICFCTFQCIWAQPTRIAGFEIPVLTPRPQSVGSIAEPIISLNGTWKFQLKNQVAASAIQVPGEWEMQGFTVNEGETAVYTRNLNIPADWKGNRIKLRFDGVSSQCTVFVNDQLVAFHEGSFVPFEADITDAVHVKNSLRVEVCALTISDRLACTSQYAVHTVGGILRKVTLFAVPQAHLASHIVTTTFDKNFKNAQLNIQCAIENHTTSTRGAIENPSTSTKSSIENPSTSTEEFTLRFKLTDPKGKAFLQASSKVKTAEKGSTSLSMSKSIEAVAKWDPEHPNLYLLTTELYSTGGVLLQSLRQRVGFRQVDIKGNQLLVNGMPVKLHGVNRHEVYPLTGRSISPELCRKDAEMFLQANCNFIRTSHYPPSEEFLDAADELGLFVESESSLCWIQHGAAPIWGTWNYLDPAYVPLMVQANVEKMVAQRNHPCIIIWSLGNESRWSPSWVKVHEVVKALDPTRPTTFHDQCWGGYNNDKSKADIAVYHYPGINGPIACDTMSRPVLFGEYAHLSCYNRRELATDPGLREAYGPPLVQMYDSIYHHPGCLGGAIWSGIDDIFHMPDGRIIGYGPWGPIDAWRRAKPEYFGMKKAYSPVVITNLSHPVLEGSTLKLTVENRYDFTNLKDIKILCRVDERPVPLTCDLKPHGLGELIIPVGATAKSVVISFMDPRGFVANEERIVLKDDKRPDPIVTEVELTENEAAYSVRQGEVTFLISKLTGVIGSARIHETQVLSQGPVFGIVPLDNDDGGKPNVAGETYQNNIYPFKNYPLYTLFANDFLVSKQQDGIKITMNVSYSKAKGRQTYFFSKDGNLTTEYEITYNGNDTLPRQFGLMMQVNKSFDKLGWTRKGDFSLYPPDDIGRNEGMALLDAVHHQSIEEWGVVPKNAWKDDANDLGSNDFRSTKRMITEASLTDKNGISITVLSDGKQSSRSWLQDGKIYWLIADYNNNGSERFYGTPHSNGRIKLKKNHILKGKLIFNIR